MVYFESNTITLYKISDNGEKSKVDCFIADDYNCLFDKCFCEKLKSIITNNQLNDCNVLAVLHESLFYREERSMPRLPAFLMYKVLKEELSALFGEKRMSECKLRIIKTRAMGRTIKIEFLLIPIDMIKKIKRCLKSIANKKFEIMY